ncbi:hypothetical protein T492DRAFT_833197 [Pavlovales sp. CCMP2436]|nr:hypothetical protein T492DRAFT_833197 [Pavlovales sp. CCMP2436]
MGRRRRAGRADAHRAAERGRLRALTRSRCCNAWPRHPRAPPSRCDPDRRAPTLLSECKTILAQTCTHPPPRLGESRGLHAPGWAVEDSAPVAKQSWRPLQRAWVTLGCVGDPLNDGHDNLESPPCTRIASERDQRADARPRAEGYEAAVVVGLLGEAEHNHVDGQRQRAQLWRRASPGHCAEVNAGRWGGRVRSAHRTTGRDTLLGAGPGDGDGEGAGVGGCRRTTAKKIAVATSAATTSTAMLMRWERVVAAARGGSCSVAIKTKAEK